MSSVRVKTLRAAQLSAHLAHTGSEGLHAQSKPTAHTSGLPIAADDMKASP